MVRKTRILEQQDIEYLVESLQKEMNMSEQAVEHLVKIFELPSYI